MVVRQTPELARKLSATATLIGVRIHAAGYSHGITEWEQLDGTGVVQVDASRGEHRWVVRAPNRVLAYAAMATKLGIDYSDL